jgi:hypothetical protein
MYLFPVENRGAVSGSSDISYLLVRSEIEMDCCELIPIIKMDDEIGFLVAVRTFGIYKCISLPCRDLPETLLNFKKLNKQRSRSLSYYSLWYIEEPEMAPRKSNRCLSLQRTK